MATTTTRTTTAFPFLPLLALLFIGLKLGGVIAWSWVWVLAPLWGGLAVALVLFGIAGLLLLVAWALDRK